MARAIWSGAVTFGLISIPVKLYTAVGRKEDIDLHLLHEKDGERIHYKRVCDKGHQVDWDEIVKGYEYEKGRWVTLTDDELDALDTQSLRTIDVATFVPLEQVDPIFFEKTYYVSPEEAGLKAYRLLVHALDTEDLIGIAKVAIREKEHLAAIRVANGEIRLHTMHWPEEIRAAESTGDQKRVALRDQEKKMARQLVQQLAGDFSPEEFEDDYFRALQEIIDKKIKGEEIVVPEAAEEPAGVIDLMEALKQSVEAARAGRDPKKAPKVGRPKHAHSAESELRNLTKGELYNKAQELEIPGRASMDKDELIRAIAGADSAA